ncbi:MAG: hypothetical protein V8Q05_07985 [Lachnospiraceae bacterium]
MAEIKADSLNMGMIEKLLNQNAPSLLLGYLRPIISQITAASPYNAYNLPFSFSEIEMYRALFATVIFHKRMKIYLYKRLPVW